MGKIEPDPTVLMVDHGGSSTIAATTTTSSEQSLRQLQSLLLQLKESRDNSEAMLQHLRSELAVLRKEKQQQHEEAAMELSQRPQLQQQNLPHDKPKEQQHDHQEQQQQLREELAAATAKTESLELELIDAKKEILKLQKENGDLKRENTLAAALASAGNDEDGEAAGGDFMEHSDDIKKEVIRMKKKINKAIRQCEVLKKRKEALEHELRTSRFREDEAVVFLRRFRSFYYMIWRNNVVRGSGGYVANRITVVPSDSNQQPAGAADLPTLLELDKLMLESGLLEEHEMGKDTPDDKRPYRPSRAAFQRSTVVAAEIAKRNAAAATTISINCGDSVSSGSRWGRTGGSVGGGMEVPLPVRGPLSAVQRLESPKVVDARQKLDGTPAGRFIAMREKSLEAELTKLTDRLVEVEQELEAEKRKNAPPTSDSKLAEEANILRKQLETKEGDLRMIVSKLRESSVLNWKIHESCKKQEGHILYLEKRLATIRADGTTGAIKSPADDANQMSPKQITPQSKLDQKSSATPKKPSEDSKSTISELTSKEETRKKGSGAKPKEISVKEKVPSDNANAEQKRAEDKPKAATAQVVYSDQLAYEKLLARQQEELARKEGVGQADGQSIKSGSAAPGSAGTGTSGTDKSELEALDESVPEFVRRRQQIMEEDREEEEEEGYDQEESEEPLGLDSSQASFGASKNIPKELRFVQVSPQGEWQRRKEAEKNKKRPARFGRPGSSNETGQAEEESRPQWMQKLKPKSDPNKPAWMKNVAKRKRGGNKSDDDDEDKDKDVPEFLRKFKKIGVRNAAETVVTAGGAAHPSHDPAATQEDGNDRSEPVHNPPAEPEPPAPAAAPSPSPPPPSPSPPASSPSTPPPASAPAPSPAAAPSPPPEPPAPASPPAPAPATKRSFLDSDSDSDSSPKKPPASSPAPPPPPSPASAQAPAPTKSSFLDSSDSDSDSDAVTKTKAPAPAPPPAPTKKSFLDSSSSESSPPKKTAQAKKSSFLDSDSDSSS